MARTVRREQQRLLLVLALIAGVLGMHALVVSGHGSFDHGATSEHMVTATPSSGHDAPAMVALSAIAGTAAAEPVGAQQSDTMPMPPSGSAHDMLHLCLAVLAALTMTFLAALIAFIVAAVRLPQLLARDGDTTPARPPPRSAVRLALLCVLRN